MVSYIEANPIHPDERDALLLEQPWPPALPRWEITNVAESQAPYRDIVIPYPDGEQGRIREYLLRFPSAPIFSIHREYEPQRPLPRHSYHTFRVLKNASAENGAVSRVYLLCNGLNETEYLGFYHWISSLILRRDPKAACVIRPFPGHLTRFSIPSAFAEKPLDQYLKDGGNLFRQFLRYLIESQWLLSVLVPHVSYRVAGGLDLLAEAGDSSSGRGSSSELATAICQRWQTLWNANTRERRPGTEIQREAVQTSIETIRALIGWSPVRDVAVPPADGKLRPPGIHLVGYSLGGFIAQSIFFTWPFAVSSCTTLCSGGALRDVAPTAFAHPEEWASVLHSLRYEVENAMLTGSIRLDKGTVAGIERDTFGYLLQIFYEVFLQDFRGEYRSRVSEYVKRLFFVVGGDDPIVQVRNVQESAPPEGINLLEIATLGHFVATEKGEWRDFWLPRVAEIMTGFAQRTEILHAQTIYENWWDESMSIPLRYRG